MTVTPPQREADLRKKPGDGQRFPVRHIVRIVVVPVPGAIDAPGSHTPGHHSLTNEQLKEAEAELKNMNAPSSSDETSQTPAKMFDVLTSTDIVVVRGEATSLRDSSEKRELCRHDDRNRDTVLRVWTESDTIEYQCDQQFEIVKVERAGWKIYGAPDDPFGNGGPYMAQEKPRAGQKPLWVWTSGLLPSRANNQQYKMTFKIGGQLVDPDVACGDPPPR
jgi:hypothetical protein